MSWRNNSIALLLMLGALILGYRFFAAPGVGVEPKSAAVEPVPPVLPGKAMTVAEKKQRFRELLVPPVDRVYRRLQRQFDLTAMLLASGAEPATVIALKQQYRVSSDTDLLAALKPHPRSVALAQAALESSWATSRFFNEANNVFGVWSFNADEPRIAAGERRGSKTIWLKKYASIEASVADYYRVLALGRAYGEFRSQRLRSDNPYD
ncbi:MAG: Bax protein, partial [Paraglaciecola psychrophila]